jgi:hypothetical protein
MEVTEHGNRFGQQTRVNLLIVDGMREGVEVNCEFTIQTADDQDVIAVKR